VRKRDERISRIRAIDREHQVVAVALSSLQIELRADPSKLGQHKPGARGEGSGMKGIQLRLRASAIPFFNSSLRRNFTHDC
jgi:hypothetical protein